MAVDYLKHCKYEILARNFRSGRIEIDIIARQGDVLVFIEVKTRSGNEFGYPEESVDEAKQDTIQTCAEEYLFRTEWDGDIRFDIIGISLNSPSPIYHIEDAF